MQFPDELVGETVLVQLNMMEGDVAGRPRMVTLRGEVLRADSEGNLLFRGASADDPSRVSHLQFIQVGLWARVMVADAVQPASVLDLQYLRKER